MAIKPPDSPDDLLYSDVGRDRLENEYFDCRLVALTILEIFQYEKKADMLSSIRKILTASKTPQHQIDQIIGNIPDIAESGLASASNIIATIYDKRKSKHPTAAHTDKLPFRFEFGPSYMELPEPFRGLLVGLRQSVDFAYALTFHFIIEQDLAAVSKETFVKSWDMIPYDRTSSDGRQLRGSEVRGPELEPKMLEYEKRAGEFLLSYLDAGMFIARSRVDEGRLPSIRILSTERVGFDTFDEWTWEKYIYWRYLRTQNVFCRVNDALLTFQSENIFSYSYLTKGLTILFSEQDGNHSDNVHWAIAQKAHLDTISLAGYLLPYYWIAYNIDLLRSQYLPEINTIRAKLVKIENTNSTSEEIRKQMKQLLMFFDKFALFANKEQANLRKLKEQFDRFEKRGATPSHTYRARQERDIFQAIANGTEYQMKNELDAIGDIRSQVTDLVNYSRDFSNIELTSSNLSLQRQLKWLAIVIGVVGIVVPVVIKLGDILNWWPK